MSFKLTSEILKLVKHILSKIPLIMLIACPHKWSKRLNKILPPDTHPFDFRIPDVDLTADICDMSEECGISSCSFFSLNEEDQQMATKTIIKFSTGELSQSKHDNEILALWEKEGKKNLYEKYGDNYICNEPLLPDHKLEYAIKNDLVDITIQDDGSSRISLNSSKVRQHDWNKLLKANQKLDDRKTSI